MANESKRPLWPYVLTAFGVVALYLYWTVEIERDPVLSRPSGGLAEIEALAERDDTNVLFILVDTLRSHRMGVYGYERDTTPFLSKLADSGVRFDRHIAQSSWTKSSMASMWSGLYPIRAGVTKFEDTLAQEVVMPAEVLADAGFKTVGLYRNGWVNGYFGFDQGFEKYYLPASRGADVALQRLRPNATAHGTDEAVVDDAIEFLRIHGHSSRWFLYLHMMDLHEYTYDDESALFGNEIPDLYDNSLLRTDWVISKLYDYLTDAGLLEKTLIVLLSDHGEAFGERGFEGHARGVFPETTETPFIISFPFKLSPGVAVPELTTNVDVWPTLFELLGIDVDRESDGLSRRDEILAAAAGEPLPAAEDEFSIAFLDEDWGRPGTPLKAAISVLNGKYRYISGSDAGGRPSELLLSLDDGQTQNQIGSHPEVVARLREEAVRHLEERALYESDDVQLDEMQRNQLRALGYSLP